MIFYFGEESRGGVGYIVGSVWTVSIVGCRVTAFVGVRRVFVWGVVRIGFFDLDLIMLVFFVFEVLIILFFCF